MRVHRIPVQVAEAQHSIISRINHLEIETVPLEQSYKRVCAETVFSDQPMPHFRRSGVDGYAVRSVDTKESSPNRPAILEVIEEIPCGTMPRYELATNMSAKIMTGAAVPDGADAVIMLEMTHIIQKEGKIFVAISKQIEAGQNITPIGFEASSKEALIQTGTNIGAGETALMAALGYANVKVYRQPKVAIFATGSELLPVESGLQPGKIRNSNSYMVAAQVREAGGIPIIMGVIADDPNEVKKRISDAFTFADLVITTGGVSVGDYDIIVDLFEQWEGTMLFNKIAMRPGSPTTVGIWRDKFLFALSGNPSACFVGFELFVKPALRGLQGMETKLPAVYTALLRNGSVKGGAYARYVRGRSYCESGFVYVEPIGPDKSSALISIKGADGLIVIPPGGKGVSEGETVSVIALK